MWKTRSPIFGQVVPKKKIPGPCGSLMPTSESRREVRPIRLEGSLLQQRAFRMCRGDIAEGCFIEARNMGYDIPASVNMCQGRIDESCFREARGMGYDIPSAVKMCQGRTNNACFSEARRMGYDIPSSVKMCAN